jgi:hypothetical protein
MAKQHDSIKTTDYEGPDRREPEPARAYDKTIVNSAHRLPPISDLGASLVQLAMANMEPKEVAVLALHLNHGLRQASIENSRAVAEAGKIEKGTHVRLKRVATVSPQHAGKVGVVQRVSKLRCYVKLKGVSRPFYVYLAEVETLTASEIKRSEAKETKAPKAKRAPKAKLKGPVKAKPAKEEPKAA